MSHSALELTASTMLRSLEQLNTIGQNIANVNTTAYKSRVSFNSVINTFDVAQNSVSGTDKITQNISLLLSQGLPTQTHDPHHFMIDGDGFFVINDGDGQQLLTRNGAFQINAAGILVTKDGKEVSGEMGSIRIPGDVTVDANGTIWSEGEEIDQLTVVSVNTDQLIPETEGYFRMPASLNNADPEKYTVRQGMLENSNVNVQHEFTNLITVMRQFEMQQKVLRGYDQMMNTGITTLGEF
ncbi:flagellar hook-basal body protein [Gynuella sunshinyii]|uniref:Flagellar basal body rod protein n=1 Tax=Gynuella sunshinyii YC6258 TaxID=1445510 RepID=A0A0C5VR65_9GAMM|nr:flagellar hook basal-body protein [Gynuella sunshinyii]AJQ92724.1 flagellar basal body rod protein [Gynuella sunshinyii YC6258]